MNFNYHFDGKEWPIFPSFDASNFHKLVNESSYVRPNNVTILHFERVCEGTIRRLAM